MSEIKLKLCPFCGSEAAFENCGSNSYYVYCKNENCTANRFWTGGKNEAIQKWNCRADAKEGGDEDEQNGGRGR